MISLVSRTLDLLVGLGLLVVTAPFMLVTVLAIKVEDGWHAPAFYTQRRLGLDGRTFNAVKFRTRRTDAAAHWAPRITRVGTVIRELRIDELPLVINVLRGHVSFILKNDGTLRF